MAKQVDSGQRGQPACPHCGGVHYGTRFDNCPYPELAGKGNTNAQSILAANGSWPVECIHGKPITEDSSCERCMNSSLGGRKVGEPLPSLAELEELIKREELEP